MPNSYSDNDLLEPTETGAVTDAADIESCASPEVVDSTESDQPPVPGSSLTAAQRSLANLKPFRAGYDSRRNYKGRPRTHNEELDRYVGAGGWKSMRRIKRYLESSDLPLEERTLRIKTECYFLDRRFGKAPVMQVNVEAPMRPVIVDLVTEEDIRKHHAAAREDDDGDYQPRRQPATPEPPVEALDASYEHPGTELESSPNPEPVAAGDSVPAPAPDYTLVRRGSAWEIEQPKKPEPPKSEWELIRG